MGHCEHGPGGEYGPQYNMENCEEKCEVKAQEGTKENCEGKDDTECINKGLYWPNPSKKRKLFRNFSGGHFGVGVSRGKRIFEKFEVKSGRHFDSK